MSISTLTVSRLTVLGNTELSHLTATGSFSGSFSGSFIGVIDSASNSGLLNGKSDNQFASVLSNQFNGNQSITGSIMVKDYGAKFSVLGNNFGEVYLQNEGGNIVLYSQGGDVLVKGTNLRVDGNMYGTASYAQSASWAPAQAQYYYFGQATASFGGNAKVAFFPRFNNFPSANLIVATNSVTCSAGTWKIEVEVGDLQGTDYFYMDVYVNGAIAYGANPYARASTGNGGNWTGNGHKTIMWTSTSSFGVHVNGNTSFGAALMLTKIA